MSKALKILSSNIASLVGLGCRFANDRELGEATKLGQRVIHRIRQQEVEPRLDKLDALAYGIGVTIPTLLSPGMDLLKGVADGPIGDLIQRLKHLSQSSTLADHEIAAISSTISLIERSRDPLLSQVERSKRQIGA